MPARYRMIGPETSTAVAVVLREERTSKGWNREQLSRELAALGFEMSASTIRHVENGVNITSGVKSQRIVSIDEARALTLVLGRNFAVAIYEILTEGMDEQE